MSRPYPIIEYAHSIGKNTAEFTTKDLAAFMKWWMKQKPRKDLLSVTPEQRKGYEKDLAAMNKYRDAQTSRLTSDQVIDVDQVDDGIAEEMTAKDIEEEAVEIEEMTVELEQGEVVVEMGLTQADIEALKWGLGVLCNDYDLSQSEYEEPLLNLKEALEGL